SVFRRLSRVRQGVGPRYWRTGQDAPTGTAAPLAQGPENAAGTFRTLCVLAGIVRHARGRELVQKRAEQTGREGNVGLRWAAGRLHPDASARGLGAGRAHPARGTAAAAGAPVH